MKQQQLAARFLKQKRKFVQFVSVLSRSNESDENLVRTDLARMRLVAFLNHSPKISPSQGVFPPASFLCINMKCDLDLLVF